MLSREEFWDTAAFVADLMPVVLRCDGDAWRAYFDAPAPLDYTLIDAVSIDRGELFGIDYKKRAHYKPAWLEDAERTNMLVLIHLEQLPFRSNDPEQKTQFDLAHLIRDKEELDAYRELGIGSGIYVPRSLRVFIVLPFDYSFNSYFFSRCAQIELTP